MGTVKEAETAESRIDSLWRNGEKLIRSASMGPEKEKNRKRTRERGQKN